MQKGFGLALFVVKNNSVVKSLGKKHYHIIRWCLILFLNDKNGNFIVNDRSVNTYSDILYLFFHQGKLKVHVNPSFISLVSTHDIFDFHGPNRCRYLFFSLRNHLFVYISITYTRKMQRIQCQHSPDQQLYFLLCGIVYI